MTFDLNDTIVICSGPTSKLKFINKELYYNTPSFHCQCNYFISEVAYTFKIRNPYQNESSFPKTTTILFLTARL